MLKIEINTDNSAFGDDWYGQSLEVVRLLQHVVIPHVKSGTYLGEKRPIKDINGTTVGFWSLDDKEPEGEEG